MRFIILLLASAGLVHSAVAATPLDTARALFKDGKLTEAQRQIEQTIRSEGATAEAYFFLAQVHLAKRQTDPKKRVHYAYDREDTKRALTALEQAVALAPQESRYQRVLGETYHRASKEAGVFSRLTLTKKAHTAHERAVELAPDDLDARWSLMMFYHQAPPPVGGGVGRAFAEAEQIKRRDLRRGLLALARLHTLENQTAEAMARLDELLGHHPDDYDALYQRGRLSALTGEQPGRGLAALRRCLELATPTDAPTHADVQWRIGEILRRQGDRTGARAAFIAALHLDAEHPEATAALAKLN